MRAAVWIAELKGEESWKMHTLNAGGWKRNNGSPTSWYLSLFLTSTKENPWEAVPRLGCDPLPRLSTDTAALHCWMLLATVRETKWVHSYRSVKLG